MEQEILEEEVKEPQKDKKNIILILVVAVVGIIAGTAGTFIGNAISHKVNGKQTPQVVEQKFSENEVAVPLDEFLINLATGKSGEATYIRIELSLLTSSEKNAEVINSSKDLIRDSIINLLRQKDAESILEDQNGVNKLKEELKNQINGDYGSALVREVFITNLVIQ